MTRGPRFRSIIGSPLAPATQVMLGMVGVALVIAAYEYYIYRNVSSGGNPRFSPGFGQLWQAFQELTEYDKRIDAVPFWNDTKASLACLGQGLGLGIVFSVIAGVAMGVFSTVRALLHPVMTAIAKIPPTSMIFLFMVIFGVTGDTFKVALIVFGISPSLIIGIMQVARDVPKNTIVKAYSLGASTPQVIVRAIVPQVIPQIIEMVRLSVGPAWIYQIAAEYISSSEGIGHGISLSGRKTMIDHILVYIIWLALLGTAIDFAFHLLSRLIAPWAAARKDD